MLLTEREIYIISIFNTTKMRVCTIATDKPFGNDVINFKVVDVAEYLNKPEGHKI